MAFHLSWGSSRTQLRRIHVISSTEEENIMDNKNELQYILARNALDKLVDMGLMSREEYTLAEGYIAEKYRPLLRTA